MSQLGGPNSQQLGGVSFGVTATGAPQATAAVNETAAAVQNLGNVAQTAGAKVAGVGGGVAGAGGLGAIGKNLKESTKEVRGFLGGLRAVESVAFRILGQFALIGTVVTAIGIGIREGWKHLVNHGKGLKDLSDDWKAVREEQDKYSAGLEKLAKVKSLSEGGKLPGTVANLNEGRIKAIEEQLAVVNKEDPTGSGKSIRNKLQAEQRELSDRIDKYNKGLGLDPGIGIPGKIARLDQVNREMDRITGLESEKKQLENRIGDALTIALRENITRRAIKDSRTSADMDIDRMAAPLEAIADLLSRQEATNSGRSQ